MEHYAGLAGMAFDGAFKAEAVRGTGSAPRCGTLRGETVAVSAASGAVGQLVGQIAKLAGCRAVAIAGGEDKLQWCREIGFDTGINYKKANDLTAAVKEACPKGVDVFFDNTGGPIHDAVMRNVAIGARVVICGRIALAAQFGKPDIGEKTSARSLASRTGDRNCADNHALCSV